MPNTDPVSQAAVNAALHNTKIPDRFYRSKQLTVQGFYM
jgi:hypothetical protein